MKVYKRTSLKHRNKAEANSKDKEKQNKPKGHKKAKRCLRSSTSNNTDRITSMAKISIYRQDDSPKRFKLSTFLSFRNYNNYLSKNTSYWKVYNLPRNQVNGH